MLTPLRQGWGWFLYGRLMGATGGPSATPIARLVLLDAATEHG